MSEIIFANIDTNLKSRIWSTHGDWTTARNGAGLQAMADCGVQGYMTVSYHISRAFLDFTIPDYSPAVIRKAFLRVRCTGVTMNAVLSPYCIVTEGHQADPLTTAHWAAQTAENVNYGQLSMWDMVLNGVYFFPINAAGLVLINAAYGGLYKVCLKTQRDLEDTPPITGGHNIWFGMPSAGAEINKPRLLLEFTGARNKAIVVG